MATRCVCQPNRDSRVSFLVPWPSHEETARLVRQHRGKRRRQHRISPCHTRLCFPTEQGWEVIVSASRKGTYDEIEQALEEALAEVRHRIRKNVQIF